DELSLGLAPLVVQDLVRMVKRINAEGVSMILVEQSANLALTVTDHAYFLEKGQIRFDGTSSDLLARDDLLRSVFLAAGRKP
ncbi:MAG: ABC transporter, partial [Actinobacteria bacterium]|nr:ABC transporter [Actinomycetota bacterium]